MQYNLGSLLVHNFKLPNSFNCKYSICNNPDCITCKFANFDFKIYIRDNYFIPIWDNSNCGSENCVYIINCKLCNAFYIGQTKSIKKRIYKHIFDIKNFVPFRLNNTCISIHFNLKNHIFSRDFSFFIYRCNLEEKFRYNLESFLINWFKKIQVYLINEFIPEIRTIFS